MRRILVALAVTGLASCAKGTGPSVYTYAGVNQRVERGTTYVWTFDQKPPTPGSGEPFVYEPERKFTSSLGRWRIEHDDVAPSAPNVYRQGGRYENDQRPRVIVNELAFGDMSARVKCRPESGAASESCGIMFRVADSDNYLVARADAIDGKVAIYRVVEGGESLVAETRAPVTTWSWHQLGVATRGTRIFVAWDGDIVVYADEEFWPGQKIGLWTGPDSISAFDDFVVRAD
jgi:hypothetical protein